MNVSAPAAGRLLRYIQLVDEPVSRTNKRGVVAQDGIGKAQIRHLGQDKALKTTAESVVPDGTRLADGASQNNDLGIDEVGP